MGAYSLVMSRDSRLKLLLAAFLELRLHHPNRTCRAVRLVVEPLQLVFSSPQNSVVVGVWEVLESLLGSRSWFHSWCAFGGEEG